MNRIHYDAPTNLQQCAYAGERTTDRSLVTCKTCLRRMEGKKGAGGAPKRTGGRNRIQIVVSNAAFAQWQAIPKGARSQVISDWLENK